MFTDCSIKVFYRIRRNIGESNIWRNSAKHVLANITCMHTYSYLYKNIIKYWQFYSKIANRQSLLLTNISSYTVYNLSKSIACLLVAKNFNEIKV